MLQSTTEAKRPRGRPQVREDAETRQLIVAAARDEFHAQGYAGASMARVAKRAGVSTRTMYRLIPTKADLFRDVVSDRISRFMLEIDEETLATLPVDEALERMLVAYGNLSLDPETVATFRLVLAECGNFPEIAASFAELATRRTTQTMEAWLRRECQRGRLALDDPSTALGMLRGMMAMEPQRAMMLGLRGAPDRAEIPQRARECARLFLDGCRSPQR